MAKIDPYNERGKPFEVYFAELEESHQYSFEQMMNKFQVEGAATQDESFAAAGAVPVVPAVASPGHDVVVVFVVLLFGSLPASEFRNYTLDVLQS